MSRLTILGAGSWGTALAVHFARAGRHEVILWARHEALARRMAKERANPDYLPDVELPPGLHPTSDLAAGLGSELTLVVVPSHGFRDVLARFLALEPGGPPAVVVSATKGIEPDSLARMSAVAQEEGERAGRTIRFAVLSGPSFAAELAVDQPTAAVIACEDQTLATTIRQTLSTPSFRLYSTSDVVGVELGGTTKNVIAIAAGVATGLGFGQNTLAALITRGLHEIAKLGVACGGDQRTFAGLTGLGDLVLTATGGLSRNRRTGIELAKGRKLEEITGDSPMVAEGIRNSLAILNLAGQQDIEMPITRQTVAILYEGKDPRRAVLELMTRELKSEAEP
ncbi:MAG TPA: NAD(P)H-dependent glycerol-3-phosphate dehydrogenase [Thermoanaerobaculia bacterium]|nr:NAD(P)H-dependent glycerol-3-phosphate dehydrogenase [Thermoanaerobaculia bacterium]